MNGYELYGGNGSHGVESDVCGRVNRGSDVGVSLPGYGERTKDKGRGKAGKGSSLYLRTSKEFEAIETSVKKCKSDFLFGSTTSPQGYLITSSCDCQGCQRIQPRIGRETVSWQNDRLVRIRGRIASMHMPPYEILKIPFVTDSSWVFVLLAIHFQ